MKGKPEHGIGRGCKVTKEEIVGLLAALVNFTEENFAALSARLRGFLGNIADRIKDVAGIRMQIIEDYPGGYPMLDVSVDASVLGMKARDIWNFIISRIQNPAPPLAAEATSLIEKLAFISKPDTRSQNSE